MSIFVDTQSGVEGGAACGAFSDMAVGSTGFSGLVWYIMCMVYYASGVHGGHGV